MAHNFTLGSQTNEDLNIIMLNAPRQALPGAIGKMEQTHNRPGAVDFGAEYGEMVFSLECAFTKTGDEDQLQQDIRTLTDHLTDAEGRPRNLDLSFPEESDKIYTVRYDGNGLNVGRGLNNDQGEFTLELVAADPRAKLPEDSKIVTLTASPDTMSVDNEGNVRTPLIIKITNAGAATIGGFELHKIE